MRRRRRELAQSSASNGDGASVSREGSVIDGVGGTGGDGEVPPTPGLEEMVAAAAAAGVEVPEQAMNGDR